MAGPAGSFRIREYRDTDRSGVEQLYPLAFPDEDLLPLVRQLLGHERVTSLVAECGGTIAGHCAFSGCGVTGSSRSVALLGPLAVRPDQQGSGIGSALVKTGLEAMRDAGMEAVLVLGDPAYYGRFGFVPTRYPEPPYPLPAAWKDAWQMHAFSKEASSLRGELLLPDPWKSKALWSA